MLLFGYQLEYGVFFQQNLVDECVCIGLYVWVYVIDNILEMIGQCLLIYLGSQVIWIVNGF